VQKTRQNRAMHVPTECDRYVHFQYSELPALIARGEFRQSLNFNRPAGFFQLLLDFLSFVFADSLFNGRRSGLNKILGFLKA
jgi:hypothetical protein